MNKVINKDLIIHLVKASFVGLLIVVCTFPATEWTYSVGIDPPLSWAYNYLFENGLKIGKHIIFPHGPLAFFMYPLPENILLSTLVDTLLKLLLTFNLIYLLSKRSEQTKWLLAFLIAYFISIVSGFNHLILANLVLLYSNIYLHENRKLRIIAYFLTAFAFYVKAYVAIVSGVIFISYASYTFYLDKRFKIFLLDCFTVIGLVMIIWIAMYGTLSGFLNYLLGIYHLAQDNSSAAAYYPYNNWWVLGLFFLTLILLLLINRTKQFYFYVILVGLSLFAAWKHGMARQDIYHVVGFNVYFLTCSIIFILYYAKNLLVNLLIVVFAFILLSSNATNSVNWKSSEYEFFRLNNFISFITEFEDLKTKSNKISQENISINKLSRSILDSIGNSTVDVYPWDYSIISANDLNWQPRVVINSYASYTSWLDSQNAAHFAGVDAPEFIIVEKIDWENINGGEYSSLDNRYLWNDEPKTVIELLINYKYWFSDKRYLFLKKRKKSINVSSSTSPIKELTVSEWQTVPQLDDGQLLRAKIKFNKSFLQRIKSFLYKDEQFWIYLKLNDNSIHKYRIVPKNAADGLWINPYIYNSEKKISVKAIMFNASNKTILKENASVTWETFDFSEPDVISTLFAVKETYADTTLFHLTNDFEVNKVQYWSELSDDLISKDAFEGEGSFLLRPNGFSSTFSYFLDSISINEMRIEVDCWVKGADYKRSNDIKLVISIDGQEESIVWKGISIDGQFIDESKWNHIYNFVNYKKTKPNSILKAYLWNNSNEEILIDEFRIRITTY